MLSFHAIGELLVLLTFEFERGNTNEVREFKEYREAVRIYVYKFIYGKKK
jgi:hypothetical protein